MIVKKIVISVTGNKVVEAVDVGVDCFVINYTKKVLRFLRNLYSNEVVINQEREIVISANRTQENIRGKARQTVINDDPQLK